MSGAWLSERRAAMMPAELPVWSCQKSMSWYLLNRSGGRMLRRNLGVLAEGALADLTVVDLRGIHHQPALRPVCCLTLSTMGSDVRHVMVEGEIVVENGRSTRVDQDKVVADCLQASRSLIRRAGIGGLVIDWIESASA